ncbi:hypothetical protein [Donghicola tyrosinivorans]|nr:hypothetical protein [Donghicola tyrosinivorans]
MGEAVTAVELIALVMILGGVVLIQTGKQRGFPVAQAQAKTT